MRIDKKTITRHAEENDRYNGQQQQYDHYNAMVKDTSKVSHIIQILGYLTNQLACKSALITKTYKIIFS